MAFERYRIRTAEAWAATRRRSLITVTLMFAIIAIPFVLNYYPGNGSSPDAQALIILAIVFVIVPPITIFRLLKKQKRALENFVLAIDENTIYVNKSHADEQSLSRIEVAQIIKHYDGSFSVRGGQKNTVITIPAEIENAAELEERLAGFSPIVYSAGGGFWVRHFRLVLLFVTAILIVFINAGNPIIIGATGVFLLVAFIMLFIFLQATRQTDPTVKRIKVVLLIPILGIIARLLYTFTDLFR